ncbi:MAG: polysaccharide biosynthesis protein [Brevinema sp.]
MKLAIVNDSVQISFQEDASQLLSCLTQINTNICVLKTHPDEYSEQSLLHQGFKIIKLSDLIRQMLLTNPPRFSDITGREEAMIDDEELIAFYRHKTVFVTGGEGFIGSHIVENLINLPVAQVIVYGHGENSAYDLSKKYGTDKRFEFVLGDIRDAQKLNQVMSKHRPSVVFHAAAHKHVPMLDSYPEEAVKTNIIGTINTIDAAIQAGVARFVLVSTDKAVNPISALGTSKRIAEKICLAMDEFSDNTRITTVRFGNVFGSIGSVVPIFLEQIAQNKPLTITDLSMLRYFMSINEAARLVLLAATMETGNLFSFDMGDPISIGDLAKRLFECTGFIFNHNHVKIIGNRGGEKKSEELIYDFEIILESKYQKLLVLQNTKTLWTKEQIDDLCKVLTDAVYCCSRDEILALLQKYIP